MDYQNRVGSKKGAGGIASDAQQNLHRRKQVDELLRQGGEVPYTFEETEDNDSKLRKNPYIYKNHSGKLVCKLCNTMHMSWSSVERHLGGKKHGLSVLRRGNLDKKNLVDGDDLERERTSQEFQKEVDERKKNLKNNEIVADCKVTKIKDEESGLFGLAIQVNYKQDTADTCPGENIYSPCVNIISGLELSSKSEINKKYIVLAFEPFENIAIEIPNKEVVLDKGITELRSIEEFNEKCTYWDSDSGLFYVQFFFKEK